MSGLGEFENIHNVFKKLSVDDQQHVKRILYGSNVETLELPKEAFTEADNHGFELAGYTFSSNLEQLRKPRKIRIGAFQHILPLPATAPIIDQRKALYELAKNAITVAAKSNVNIFCFQELWNLPFFFGTREKQPWCEYAEPAENGPTTKFLQELARQHNMVILSSILERDENHCDILWNATVVIDNHGVVLGKHRKNHIPRVGDFSESTYYMEGNTGHPVFETEFGKIGINICFGHHHPLNWMMFGINGAEIVFNPSAVIGEMNELFWGVETRNAAIANSFYSIAINRVGTEVFPNKFSSGDGKPPHNELGHFFGSSYVAGPNGSRTPSLSRTKTGLLVSEFDLNLCRQVRDTWVFPMTRRLDLYAKSLTNSAELDYKPQVVKRQ